MANQQIIEVKTLGTEKASRSLGKVDRSIGDLATSALKYAAAAGAIILGFRSKQRNASK